MSKRILISLAMCAAFAAASGAASAQQVSGTPGSPGATTTIPGDRLPAPPAEVRRRDRGNRAAVHVRLRNDSMRIQAPPVADVESVMRPRIRA